MSKCCACGYKCNDPECKRGCERLTAAEREVIETAIKWRESREYQVQEYKKVADAASLRAKVDSLNAERAPKPPALPAPPAPPEPLPIQVDTQGRAILVADSATVQRIADALKASEPTAARITMTPEPRYLPGSVHWNEDDK